jgi:hypothetical protein
LAEHAVAVSAQNNSLGVTENSGNLKASRALNVHEKRIRALHKSLKLVGSELELRGRIQQISRHFDISLLNV